MAEKKTKTGKTVQAYIKDVLKDSTAAGKAALKAGYPDESSYSQAYYAGVPYLYEYGDAEQNEALGRMGDMYGAYGEAGDYNKTDFGDIEGRYNIAGQYDPSEYEMADYTTQNIRDRMTPYEELVSNRARARLKRGYDEGRAERDVAASRAQAFGGSGQAVQEEVARRNYLEQMQDMDATNLQSAYEAGVGLYGKELSDRLSAQQATEASRQFAKQTQFSGIEGLMGARQQTAAQEAAAKEAEFAGLQGQAASAEAQAKLAEQKKNMQLANLGAMQAAGRQKEDRLQDENEYGLDIAAQQANILAPLSGGAIQTKQKGPSTGQMIVGGLTAAAGAVQGLGGFRDGGIVYSNGGYVYRHGGRVYSGGGLADLEPQYYTDYGY